jgi:hypothetical protein
VTPITLFIGFLVLVVLWAMARRFVSARASAAGILAVALAAVLATWLIAPGLLVLKPDLPSGTAVGWELPLGWAGIKNDLTPQSTVITMVVDHPGCTPSSGGDWLGEPAIAYTPWSVTITMHTRDDLANNVDCRSYYLSGEVANVQLSEPLGNRQLFDGSKSPPHPRSPSDTPSSMSR